MLNGCPVALKQGRYIYRHDAVLTCLISELQAAILDVRVYADVDGKHASDGSPATIPLTILVSSYRPDIVVFNEELKAISFLVNELTYPLNSSADLTAAHNRKAQKPEYLQIVAELDCLGFSCTYHMVEIGCLGHFCKESISAI